MYEQILYEPGTVARVRLNRPEYRNAQSWRLLDELDDALTRAASDPKVRVIVVSGEGAHFSAGHDLGTPSQVADQDERGGLPEEAAAFIEQRKKYFLDNHLRWRNLPKPTIAMVHGYCIWGGWMIASAMDFIFACEEALFLPALGFSVTWDLPPKKVKEILYESRFLTAAEALNLGFVNRIYSQADLERETMTYAAKVAESDPLATAKVKFFVNQTLDTMGYTSSVSNLAFNTFASTYATKNAARDSAEQQPGSVRRRRQAPGVGRALKSLSE